jgi:hypothetical protein
MPFRRAVSHSFGLRPRGHSPKCFGEGETAGQSRRITSGGKAVAIVVGVSLRGHSKRRREKADVEGCESCKMGRPRSGAPTMKRSLPLSPRVRHPDPRFASCRR